MTKITWKRARFHLPDGGCTCRTSNALPPPYAPRGVKILRKSRTLFPCPIASVASRFFETTVFMDAHASAGVRARTYRILNAFGTDTCLSTHLGAPLRAISDSRLLSDIRIWLDSIGVRHIQRQRPDAPRVAFTRRRFLARQPNYQGYRSLAIPKEF